MQNDKEKLKNDLKRRIYQWVLHLIAFLDAFPQDGISRTFVSQVLRSGTSVGANYIEGQAASLRKDFVNFLRHALKSANESKFWLAIMRDTKRGDSKAVQALLEELIEIANILAASIITAKGRR